MTIVLPERQYRAMCHLLQCEEEALIDDLTKAVQDSKPLVRTTMRALVAKGFAEEIRFKGMVRSFHAPHISKHVAYRATAKARRCQFEMKQPVSREEDQMPKAPRHRTEANRKASVEVALLQFIDAIESTGGVLRNPTGSGHFVPVADEDWVDLGEVYMQACKALDRKPMVKS